MSGDPDFQNKKPVLVAGASGTIGRAVVHELVCRGHAVTASVRDPSEAPAELDGANVVRADVTSRDDLARVMKCSGSETVISCLASRSGAPKDAEAIDFQANLNLLKAAEGAGVDHFVLLSAICVQRPKLAFQHAKIAFERALKASEIAHTIVRPTAFFK